MDRDSLGNVIVEPMDRVVLDSTSVGNNMDSTGSPGNTPTPTGCVSPTMAPMMEEEEEEIRPVLQEAWTPLQQPTALQQLAAVAERKAQEEEEEQMEVGGLSPAGTPTPGSPSSTPPPLCLRELPSSTTTLPSPLDHRDLSTSRTLDHRDLSSSRPLDHRDCRDGSAPRIAPSSLLPSALYKPSVSHAQSLPPMHLHPEYDLPAPASSAHHSFTPSASPLTARHLQTAPAPTPSPDSAIHSTIYSPSQSPVQSRHGPFSGFSSPYHSSLRTTPSLSR